MLALRLPPEIEKRLENLARRTGRTKSFYAREAILRHIEDLEDYHRAKGRFARSSKRVPLEQLESEAADGDDPFATFSEWASDEDEKAYAGL